MSLPLWRVNPDRESAYADLACQVVAATIAQVGRLTGHSGGLPLGVPLPDAPSGAPDARMKGIPGGARQVAVTGSDRSCPGGCLGGLGWVVGLACLAVGCQAVGVMSDADRARAWTVVAAVARMRAASEALAGSAGEIPAGHEYLEGLGFFRVWRRGQRAGTPSVGVNEDARSRRRFAERLADTLAYPGTDVARYGRGGDFVGASSQYVPVAASPLAQRVIAQAEAVTEQVATIVGETRVYATGAGVVVLVHGPDWSLVFDMNAVDTTIRVCGDEWDEVALSVDEDPDPQVQSRLLAMVYDVLWQLQRVSVGGDRFDEAPPGSGNQ